MGFITTGEELIKVEEIKPTNMHMKEF